MFCSLHHFHICFCFHFLKKNKTVFRLLTGHVHEIWQIAKLKSHRYWTPNRSFRGMSFCVITSLSLTEMHWSYLTAEEEESCVTTHGVLHAHQIWKSRYCHHVNMCFVTFWLQSLSHFFIGSGAGISLLALFLFVKVESHSTLLWECTKKELACWKCTSFAHAVCDV